MSVENTKEVIIGEEFTFTAKVKNNSSEKCEVRVPMVMTSTYYTGVNGEEVVKEIKEATLEAGEGINVAFNEPFLSLMSVSNTCVYP